MSHFLFRLKHGAHAALTRLADTRNYLRLRQAIAGVGREHRVYLNEQLERTLSKRTNDPGIGARILVGRAIELSRAGPESAVLCIGCRNTVELDLFRARGLRRVVGIDLFSQHPDVRVMDMHAMMFANDSFDIIYASHSLEHARALGVVLGEIARVARPGAVVAAEIPVGPRRSPADRIEFSGVNDLLARIEPYCERVLWFEEQAAGTTANDQGTPIARLVFVPKEEGAVDRVWRLKRKT